jgi:uncharacterized iron-regulated protein
MIHMFHPPAAIFQKAYFFAVFCTLISFLSGFSTTNAKAENNYGKSENPALEGQIWAVAAETFTDLAALATAVQGADFILLGEKHDNPAHHDNQASLVRAVTASGRRPRLVMEMLDEGRQSDIDAYVAGGGDAAGFGPALAWAESGWPDYAMYRPILQAAFAAGLPVVAGNLPRESVRAISRAGLADALPTDRRQRLGLDEPPAPAVVEDMREEMFESHCRLMPKSAMGPLIEVQRARDAVMAEHMVDGGSAGAVLIAGNGHVRADRGVPAYLRRLAPGRQIVTVAMVEADVDKPDPRSYADRFGGLPFDYIWFTARANERDHCAELRKRFGKNKKSGR